MSDTLAHLMYIVSLLSVQLITTPELQIWFKLLHQT